MFSFVRYVRYIRNNTRPEVIVYDLKKFQDVFLEKYKLTADEQRTIMIEMSLKDFEECKALQKEEYPQFHPEGYCEKNLIFEIKQILAIYPNGKYF